MAETINKWWDYYMGDEVWIAVHTEQTRPKFKTKVDKEQVSEHRREGKVVAYTIRVKEGSKQHRLLFEELQPVRDKENCIKRRKSKKE